MLSGKAVPLHRGTRYDIHMRSSVTFSIFFLAIGFFSLPHFAHAAIPFFGPILPQGINAVCPAGWGMLILVVNNLIEFFITFAIIFVAPIMISYAGFLFVINSVNPAGKEHAKKILTNTIVGIVIALSGWLIVDAVMAVLYNPTASSGTTSLEQWKNILSSNGASFCLPQRGSLPGEGLNQAKQTTNTSSNQSKSSNTTLPSLKVTSPSASPSTSQGSGIQK